MTKAALIGFARALGVVILTAVLSYVGSADNLSFLNPATATLISGLALALEHVIEAKTGRALMGAVKS
jgi:hypothetical protein